ncbi:DNA repair protein RadA [Trueperella pyogenes]|uniref:DNA repair protein RadA n=1 Tax=Trueperella pyogenes TaxID=1661 RepID=UPI000D52ED30|nr:DNA repair protein RadA [Trueperella pyogenes]AWG03240.1 DNA repair protein RadA [Trueperella pyogenes]AWG15969.1 DNA repair protein RadA [Trueperella pyogenes]AZR04853.1 DNA repair protein RadA [Trueperella pyogenes]
MAKNQTFQCRECGWSTVKWVGRCGQCQAWGTIEESAHGVAKVSPLTPRSPAQPITEVSTQASVKSPTGVAELDRVLGGGIVPGVVILLAGEPGVGKSTLLLDVAAKAAAEAAQAGRNPVLYVTGEESASQVRSRAERIGALHPHLLLAAEADLTKILGHVDAVRPSLLIVDSVQTVADPKMEGSAGGVAQVRAITSALVTTAKAADLPIVLVGHVTKDGSIAGPRALEHLVDVVCQFEGDRHSRLRLVRAVKNRYGATDEVGCFELVDSGINGLADPSGLFLSARDLTVPGTCVTVTLEGRRPMPVEVQALSVPAAGPPRRTTSGVDSSRVAMMLAVLQSRLGVQFERNDIFVSTVGGARASEPAVDVAIALALASTALDLPLAPGVIAVGEVSLTGELRPVVGLQRRLNEAARLGFHTALVPATAEASPPAGMRVRAVADVKSAACTVLPLEPER